MDTYAKQTEGQGGTYAYTNNPDQPPYCGGTASGGAWMSPPEVGGEDYAAGLAPAGRSISSSVFGMAPGVSLGFGLPDLPTGGIRTGYGLTSNGSTLEARTYDAAGAGTLNFRFTDQAVFHVRDRGGAPTTPDSGFVAMYADGDQLYTKDDNGLTFPILGNINGLTETTTPATDDELAIYDASASAVQKQTRANFLSRFSSDVQGTLTALAAGGQNSGGPITSTFIRVSTVATTGDSITLPTAAVGRFFIVENDGANSMDVFPNTSDEINSEGSNNALALPAGKWLLLFARSIANWRAVQIN